jgi:hypothetical protein
MPTIHDPYLDTIRRSLNEEKIKSRKKKIENSTTESKSFFSKNIIISNYIHLPQSLEKIILLVTFVFIPHILGILVMFILVQYEIFKECTKFSFDIFMLTWTIGYETIALILLILIIKSAFNFTKQ